MLNTLNHVIQQIEAREDFLAPDVCAMCWYKPVCEGGVCADCLFTNKIKVTEGAPELDTII